MRRAGKELVPVDEEQATIERITELRAQGCSLPQIVDVLASEGRKTKRGGRWHPQTVSRVLDRAPIGLT